DVVDDGGKRALVQANHAVGEVVVIHQHDVANWSVDQFWNFGAGTADVDFDALCALKYSVRAGAAQVVDAHGDSVITEFTGTRLGAFLRDCKGGVLAVLLMELWRQGGDAGGGQPLIGPARQIAPRGLGERLQQVREG